MSTSPIPETLTTIPGFTSKLRIFKHRTSKYWQVRYFRIDKYIHRTLKTTDIAVAMERAKDFYAEQLQIERSLTNQQTNEEAAIIAAYRKNIQALKNKKPKLIWDRQNVVSKEDVLKMLNDQNYSCNICAVSFKTLPSNACCVDHDHKTGQVRSLLCRTCNLMIGYAKDNPRHCANAAMYLAAYGK